MTVNSRILRVYSHDIRCKPLEDTGLLPNRRGTFAAPVGVPTAKKKLSFIATGRPSLSAAPTPVLSGSNTGGPYSGTNTSTGLLLVNDEQQAAVER